MYRDRWPMHETAAVAMGLSKCHFFQIGGNDRHKYIEILSCADMTCIEGGINGNRKKNWGSPKVLGHGARRRMGLSGSVWARCGASSRAAPRTPLEGRTGADCRATPWCLDAATEARRSGSARTAALAAPPRAAVPPGFWNASAEAAAATAADLARLVARVVRHSRARRNRGRGTRIRRNNPRKRGTARSSRRPRRS